MTRSKIRRGVLPKKTKHTLHRKRQKTVDYRDKSFDEFRLMIVGLPPKLDIKKSKILSSSFDISRGNKSNEVISNMVLTHLLKRWVESKTQSHPRLSAMTPSGNISLKYCCIIMK